MADDPNINIALKTTADTTGAEKTVKALNQVETEAKETAKATAKADDNLKESFAAETRRLEEMQAKAATLKKETASLKETTEDGASRMKLLGAATTGVAIGGAILRDRLIEIRDALKDIDPSQLEKISPIIAAQVEAAQKQLEWMSSPMDAIQRMISGSTVKEAFDDMNEAVKLAAKSQSDEWDRQHGKRLENLRKESDALSDQERQMNRLLGLNRELSEISLAGANQEVEWARLTGGDVALAQARAMTEKLNADLGDLNNSIATAQLRATSAGQNEKVAIEALNVAMQKIAEGQATAQSVGLDKLQKTADDAGQKGEEARQNLADVLAKSQGAQLNILRGAEISLFKTEKEYEGKFSPAAKAALDAFYNRIKTEVAQGTPAATEAIAQIQSSTAEIRQAVAAKSQEVSQSLAQTTTQAARDVSNIGTTAAQVAAATDKSIKSASDQIKEAMDLQTNTIILALNKVAAGLIASNSRIKAVEATVSQMLDRPQ